ncbi:MAG: class B sortase [Lachnospiraceae bacterium]|nr:class B sortase [Lachnospiraceae bacterium]
MLSERTGHLFKDRIIRIFIIMMCSCLVAGCGFRERVRQRREAEARQQAEAEERARKKAEREAEEKRKKEEEERKKKELEALKPLAKYNEVLKINPYVAGWLKIDDSVIDEPVVYTPGDQNYFLHRALDGSDESKGTLFIAINWRDENNNTLIYGHNMKDGTAFGSLSKFADPSYGLSHNILHFDTLYEERDYELYAAFYSQIDDEDLETEEDAAALEAALEEGEIELSGEKGQYYDIFEEERANDNGRFRYYYFTDLSNRDDFEYFAKNVKERAIYDTGIEAEWGDEFVTLSTCSYHVRNGRFVVVGIRKKQ